MSEWRPMATAPKDGTIIDIFVWSWFWTADGDKQYAVGFRLPEVRWDFGWKDTDGNDPLRDRGFVWDDGNEGAIATNWMPTPESPPSPDEMTKAP